MGQLADAIRQVNERELDANESAIASCFPPPPQLTPDTEQRLIPWLYWCEQQRVRSCPTSVAAYVRYQQDQGVSRQLIAERLEAIEAMHTAASLANPIATVVVRVTTGASTIDAPRSWPKDSKLQFAELPVEIQSVIARREHQREVELRRMQNELADLKKLLRLQAEAATKSADNTTTEKGIDTHGNKEQA